MSKFYFSKRSKDNILTLHPNLRKLVTIVLDLGLFDFSIIEGHRVREDQMRAYNDGKSKLKFPESKHNKVPSLAFDYMLYINGEPNMKDTNSYYMASGVFSGIAKNLGINIRLGADWDGDFSTSDQNFNDLMHIELKDD